MSCTSADDMKRVFRLPKLPSNTYGEELLRRNYHKSQILGARGEPYASLYDIPPDYDTLMVNKSVRTNMLGSLRAAKAQANPSTALTTIVEAASPQKKGTSAMVSLNHPSLLLDKKVLRFYCFFRESVTESPIERERVRKCVLLFHLEDQTMCVVETAVENSGMTQGTLIRRHHFPDIGLQDLDVGVDLELYGKVFHITNCDPFTRDFLERARGHCPPGEEEPVDEFTLRKRLDQLQRSRRAPRGEEFNTNAKMTPQEVRNTTKFLAFDRQVLHFRAVWDDTKSLNGSLRFFSLYYFLADDSIEVIEENENNCGRDPFPSFVRRQKCPRVQREEKFKNTTAALTFCNRRESTPFYTDADLRIGAHLNIFGRDFLLYDCDEHTKSHLRKVHNVQDCTPLDVHPRAAPPLKREPPPHNGFGDEEDSLGSWKHLILKPLKRDGTRYMEHSGTTLKFEMRLDAQGDPCNDLRRFVLTFFISDDTLAIFEPPLRNSGIVAGKFLQRSRIKNPETGQYFRAAELYIGKRLKIHDHVFILLACDERSLTFMEQHSSDFPHSDINTIMNKLRAMILASGTGLYDALGAPDIVNHCIRYDHFSEILRRLALDLSIQEVLTVFRYFEHCGESHILTYGELHKRLGTDATGNFLSLEDTDDWKMLYERSLLTKSYSHNELKNHEKQKTTVRRNRAAYTARHFLELYKERQQLFTTAFHQICDYSPDNLIGAEQFRTVVLERLSVDFEKEDLDALCEKLFPRELRRASYNEFLKLLNGTSSHAHNLEDIIKREH